MRCAYRASLFHFIDDPLNVGEEECYEHIEDGILVVENGRITAVGKSAAILPTLTSSDKVIDYRPYLLMPGFIDGHVHYPQTTMIASYGEQLLEWLEKYTFPHEERFIDPTYAATIANLFLDQLLANGTTTAAVFCTHLASSVDPLFAAAQARRMRLIAGLVVGDRHLPSTLLSTAERAYEETLLFAKRWHNCDRLLYAVTPRFAPTSTEKQLALLGEILVNSPDLYLHTHLSENQAEVAWVKDLFPWSRHYLDVYHHYGYVRPKAIFAHAIHLCDEERALLAKGGAAIACCPSSNFFLGSGLFPWHNCRKAGIRLAIGTDIGAGTSFSLPRTLGEAYKMMQLQGLRFNPIEAFYHATLGGARALYLDHLIGNFSMGKEADFVLLNPEAIPLLQVRYNEAESLEERLFLFMILGDERVIHSTYVYGQKVAGNS